MPAPYWTRKLELRLIELIREKEIIWRPIGNTNHNIHNKYKAYAEIAAKLGHGFTARSIRDRWVNMRSTFNHNSRKVLKSQETAKSPEEVYVPCWTLWKPLQFLRNPEYPSKADDSAFKDYNSQENNSIGIGKTEPEDYEEPMINIRQRGKRTDRPRKKYKVVEKKVNQCKEVLDNLLIAMSPLNVATEGQSYWFFGRHVTERLNAMRPADAKCARNEILKLLETCDNGDKET